MNKMKKLLLTTLIAGLAIVGFAGATSAASTSKQFSSCTDAYGCMPAYLSTSEDSYSVYATVELTNGGIASASNTGWYKFELQRLGTNYIWSTLSTKYAYAEVDFGVNKRANVSFSNISNVKNADTRVKVSEYSTSSYTGLRQVVYSYYWNR